MLVANAITVGRVILLFIVIWLMYGGDAAVAQWCALALALVIALDAVDGWVARRYHEVNQFGAIFDIVGDRIVENVMWIVFSDLDLVPVWVPILVVSRGFLVDGLRSSGYEEGMTPFGEHNMMRSPLTQWLTAGRFMRGLFGVAKAAGFVFLAMLYAQNLTADGTGLFFSWFFQFTWFRALGWFLVWTAVVLTVVRAIPVVIDAVAYLRSKSAASGKVDA
jgi:CDP-diacylglycerol--glycerol-3-phosphate 3-phosphatidyltransferase